jgi:CPA1 family monovalent cation:H+ antiporter
VNDASGLVLYKFAVAAVLTGAFSLAEASLQFAFVAVGGTLAGIGLAFAFVAVHRRLGDPFIEVLTSLAVPYVAYILAESLHLSGVLAVVAAGLVRGRYSPEIVSAEMRILGRSMWNILVFLLNSLIFIIIGLQLSGILERLGDRSLTELLLQGVLISAVAILVRFAWIYPATYLPRLASRLLRRAGPPPAEAEVFIMSWCGMRGIVSLAAALALPVALESGEPFPYRDLIIFLTFVVIAITLIVQGLTLAPLIRRLKVGADLSVEEEHHRASRAMVSAAIGAIEDVAGSEGVPADLAQRIIAEFTEKLSRFSDHGHAIQRSGEWATRLREAAIRAERQALIRVWRDNEIGDEVLHHLEEMLDYQESRL